MKRAIFHYAGVLASVFGLVFIASVIPDTSDDKTVVYVGNEVLPQVIKSASISDRHYFAGERVPLENFDVAERLDKELIYNSYFHSSTLLHLKRANRYFPIIEAILAEHQVPNDFKYLAVAESSLANAISYAGATGIWQFLEGTAKELGLEISEDVDERYHLEKSTIAACDYLKQQYEKFGNWTLAAAAYNAGPSRVRGYLKDQRESSFYDLNTNEETSRYVFKILAAKEVMSNPRKYGFHVDESDLYRPLEVRYEVKVDTTVENWGDFAHQYGTTYRMLKVYNPWMRTEKLKNPGGKTYFVKIPAG